MAGISSGENIASKFFYWGVLLGSAVLAADLLAAGIDDVLLLGPQPFASPASAQATSMRSAAQGDIGFVLRQPVEASPVAVSDSDKSSSSGAPTKSGNLSASSLGLTLTGTVVSGYYSSAIFDKDGQSVFAAVGDEVDGVRVLEVHSTWVVVGKGEQKCIVALDSLDHTEENSANAEAGSEDKSSSVVVAKPRESADGDEKGQLSLDDIRAQLDDTAKVGRQVRVIPQEKDGAPYGTRVEFRTNKNIMSRLGLRDGDILLSVNGAPTRSVEEMYQGYMTIRNADALEFNLDRGGSIQTIRYELGK